MTPVLRRTHSVGEHTLTSLEYNITFEKKQRVFFEKVFKTHLVSELSTELSRARKRHFSLTNQIPFLTSRPLMLVKSIKMTNKSHQKIHENKKISLVIEQIEINPFFLKCTCIFTILELILTILSYLLTSLNFFFS